MWGQGWHRGVSDGTAGAGMWGQDRGAMGTGTAELRPCWAWGLEAMEGLLLPLSVTPSHSGDRDGAEGTAPRVELGPPRSSPSQAGHWDGVGNVAPGQGTQRGCGTAGGAGHRGDTQGCVGCREGFKPPSPALPCPHSRCWKALKMLMRVKWSPLGCSSARRRRATASSRCVDRGTKQGDAGGGQGGHRVPPAPEGHPVPPPRYL